MRCARRPRRLAGSAVGQQRDSLIARECRLVLDDHGGQPMRNTARPSLRWNGAVVGPSPAPATEAPAIDRPGCRPAASGSSHSAARRFDRPAIGAGLPARRAAWGRHRPPPSPDWGRFLVSPDSSVGVDIDREATRLIGRGEARRTWETEAAGGTALAPWCRDGPRRLSDGRCAAPCGPGAPVAPIGYHRRDRHGSAAVSVGRRACHSTRWLSSANRGRTRAGRRRVHRAR
jgi:hypothetical protein